MTTPLSPTNPQRKKVLTQVQQWNQFISQDEEECLELIKNDTQYRPINISDKIIILNNISTPPLQEASTHDYEKSFTSWFMEEYENNEDNFMSEQLEQLNSYKNVCESMISQVQSCVQLCEEIKEQYQFVSNKTGQLHKDCEKLVHEKDNLAKIVEGIESRLKYFNDMELYTQELNTGSIDLYSPDFTASVKLLDESIRFLSNNQSYREAKVYLGKYRQLMNRTLGFLRDHLLSRLKQASIPIVQQEATISAVSFDKEVIAQELSLYYIQYRASVEVLKPLIRDIEIRAPSQEYTVYLLDVADCYFEQRRSLMFKRVDARIQELIKQNNLVKLVELGCAYLMTICSEEEKLFKFFFSSEMIYPQLRGLIELFSSTLYEGLRAMVINEDDLDTLCDLVDTLRSEMLLNKSVSNAAIEPVVHRMIQDVQERLIFRASLFISARIRSFKPVSDDYNYPERLEVIKKDSKTNYEHWYPTLPLTLQLLSKLYRSLDIGVFESLAQEAVSLCTSTLIEASKLISDKNTVVDAELFLIKHLLTLCEQISAFNVSFKSTQIELDFSSLREGIAKFLRGQSKVSNLIFDIMSQSRPKIVHNNVDTKRDLENHLKAACESFILNVARLCMDPLMNFLRKVALHKKVTGSTFQFETIPNCIDLHNTTIMSVKEVLPSVRSKISQYLTSVNTQEDLFKHIKTQLTDRYQEFFAFLEQSFTPEQFQELQTKIESVPAFMSLLDSLSSKT